MGEVVDLGEWRERLVSQLRVELETSGSVTLLLVDLHTDPVQWRSAARAAARELGRPVQTGATTSSVWAVLSDWPATDPEREHHQEQLRRVVEAAARLDDVDP